MKHWKIKFNSDHAKYIERDRDVSVCVRKVAKQ